MIEHLGEFVGRLESWLADVTSTSADDQRARETQIAREHATLADLRASRAKHMASYSKRVVADDDLAHLALEPVRALGVGPEQVVQPRDGWLAADG